MLYLLYRSHDDDTATLRQPPQEKAEEDAHSVTSYFLFLNCFFFSQIQELFSLIQVTNARLNQLIKPLIVQFFAPRLVVSKY